LKEGPSGGGPGGFSSPMDIFGTHILYLK